jgi:hypothetical protein
LLGSIAFSLICALLPSTLCSLSCSNSARRCSSCTVARVAKAVRLAASAGHADMPLHSQGPRLAVARLVHFGVARLIGVLARSRCAAARTINERGRDDFSAETQRTQAR